MLVVLSLAAGILAAVDLRRLQTPRGTALAWTGAAVFGDCDAYRRLSINEAADSRSTERLCRDLQEETVEARENAAQIGFDVLAVEQRGREATVEVEVRKPDATARVELPLRRKGGGWAVVLTNDVCSAIGCA